jgi:hypothetical protein
MRGDLLTDEVVAEGVRVYPLVEGPGAGADADVDVDVEVDPGVWMSCKTRGRRVTIP